MAREVTEHVGIEKKATLCKRSEQWSVLIRADEAAAPHKHPPH